MTRFIEKYQVWAFLAVFFLMGTSWGMETLLFPVYALDLGATTAQIGLIEGLISAGLLLTSIPAGFYVDRAGSRRAYIGSALLLALVFSAISQSTNIGVLLSVVVLLGAIAGFTMASLHAAYFNRLSRFGKSKTGWSKGATAIGLFFVGPIAAGVTIKAFGPSTTFLIVSALWAIPTVLAFLVTRSAAREARTLKRAKREHVLSPPEEPWRWLNSVLPEARKLFSNRSLLAACVLEGIGIATVIVFASFITVLSLKNLHLDPIHVAWLLALEGIGYAAVLFLGGGLLRFSARGLTLAAFAGTGLSFSVFGLAPGFVAIAAASAGLGLALGLIALRVVSVLASLSTAKGSVAGFYGFTMGLFSTAGPIAAGFLGEARGVQAIFWAVLIFYVGLAFVLLTSRAGNAWLMGEPKAETLMPVADSHG